VKLRVYTINGFSSHADQPQLFDWLRSSLKKNSEVILVHGEEKAMSSFKELTEKELGVKPKMPELYSSIEF